MLRWQVASLCYRFEGIFASKFGTYEEKKCMTSKRAAEIHVIGVQRLLSPIGMAQTLQCKERPAAYMYARVYSSVSGSHKIASFFAT